MNNFIKLLIVNVVWAIVVTVMFMVSASTPLGDMNKDGHLDIKDLSILASVINSSHE